MTGQEVHVVKALKDRKKQRALLQFFKPENWFEVRAALLEAGRADLIGKGCDALIPGEPPREALAARRDRAQKSVSDDHYHAVGKKGPGTKEPLGKSFQGSNKPKSKGYRPNRATAGRRPKPGRPGPKTNAPDGGKS